MNFILISPYFPHNFQLFATRLREHGVRVLGIGSEPYHQLGERLHGSLAEYYQVGNMEDWQEVARAVAYFYSKYGKIDRLESNNEYWLELDAYLRTEFNIPGLKSEELKDVKYKSRMKELFREAGAPVVDGYLVNNLKELKALEADLTYPLVAKPDSGVGTAATYRLDSRKDLKNFKEKWDGSTPYFIESFVEKAQLCTYDGLIDSQGNIVFETSFNYSLPTLDVIGTDTSIYYIVQPEIDPKLRDIGRRIIKTFGHRERFFHIEFFRMEDGSYITLEYNGRLAGGFTIDVYNFAHSIDLYDEYARLVTGKGYKGSSLDSQYALGIGRRGEDQHYKNNLDAIRARYGSSIKMIDATPLAFRDLLGDTFFILVTDKAEELEEIVEFVLEG